MPGFVGLPELILFGIVALLIFGPKKLPEMGRSLGRGMREFKDSVSGPGSARDADRSDVVDATPHATLALDRTDDTSDPFAPVAESPRATSAPAAPSDGSAHVNAASVR